MRVDVSFGATATMPSKPYVGGERSVMWGSKQRSRGCAHVYSSYPRPSNNQPNAVQCFDQSALNIDQPSAVQCSSQSAFDQKRRDWDFRLFHVDVPGLALASKRETRLCPALTSSPGSLSIADPGSTAWDGEGISLRQCESS